MFLIPGKPRELWRDRFDNMDLLQDEINRLFDFTRWPDREQGLLEGVWSPAVDIYDGKDSLVARADIPGMKKEDIEVVIDGKKLSVKGEKKQETSDAKGSVRAERFYGAFYRSVTLPVEVDAGKVSAAYTNGVLEITLPKKEEYKPKQIKIEIK